jgi:hypothetical protein
MSTWPLTLPAREADPLVVYSGRNRPHWSKGIADNMAPAPLDPVGFTNWRGAGPAGLCNIGNRNPHRVATSEVVPPSADGVTGHA